jgi:hypothetical protein
MWNADSNGIFQNTDGAAVTGPAAVAIATNFRTISTLISALSSDSSAAVSAALASHEAATGTAVHGLGTASTHAAGDFDAAGAASAVNTSLATHQALTGTAVHGLGTASTRDVGTGVGNVVVMAAGPKLPAVDGSQLTNLPSSPAPTLQSVTDAGATTTDAVTAASFGSPSGSDVVLKVGGTLINAVRFKDGAGNVRGFLDMAAGFLYTQSGCGFVNTSSGINGNGLDMLPTEGVHWRNGNFGSYDADIHRISAGVAGVGNGSGGIGQLSFAAQSINSGTTPGTAAGQVCYDSGHAYMWNGSSWLRLDN